MAEVINLLADLTLGKVNARAFGVALQQEQKKAVDQMRKEIGTLETINKPETGADVLRKELGTLKAHTSGGPGITGGTEITAAFQAVLGDSLNEAISILQNIAKFIIMFLGTGLLIKVIADVLTAMWGGFKSLTKVWGGILAMITKMVEPFVNLVIPLLLPFLRIMSLMAKMINMTIMPIFNAMMKAFAPKGEVMTAAMDKIMGGDIMGGIGIVLADTANTFMEMRDEIKAKLMPLFEMLGGWIMSFLTMDLTEVHNTINELLGDQLGTVVNMFIDMLYFGISAITGFIAQLVGAENFNKVFGEDAFKDVEETNKGFAAGVNIGEVLQGLWTELDNFLTAIIENPVGTLWTLFTDTLNNLITAFSELVFGVKGGKEFSYEEVMSGAAEPKAAPSGERPGDLTQIMRDEGLIGAINKIVSDITGVDFKKMWDDHLQPAFTALALAVNTAITTAFGENGEGGVWGDFVTAMGSKNSGLIGALNAWTDNMLGFANPAQYLMDAISDWVSKAFSEGGDDAKDEGYTLVNQDFISRPGQGTSHFSPDDTIIGIKDPSKLGGGGGNTYNITVVGNGEREIGELVKKVIEDFNSTASREGNYQRGY